MNQTLRLDLQITDETALKGLERLRAGIGSEQIRRGIGEEVKKAAQERILRGGPDPEGKAWIALSPITLKRKPQGPGNGILRESGRLMDSITWQLRGTEEVAIGSAMVHARIHQMGGMAGRGRKVHIPARPYLGVSAEQKAKLEQKVVAWIKRLAER